MQKPLRLLTAFGCVLRDQHGHYGLGCRARARQASDTGGGQASGRIRGTERRRTNSGSAGY